MKKPNRFKQWLADFILRYQFEILLLIYAYWALVYRAAVTR